MSCRITLSKLASAALLAIAALAADAGSEARAEQCVHNKFGKSFVAAKVEWYERDAFFFKKNETTDEIEVWSKTGTIPTPLKSETITVGFSSCINDFATRLAVVKVAGANVATWAARTGTAVAAAGAAAGVVVSGCAGGTALTIMTAGAAGAGGVALCAVSAKAAASAGFAVGGSLSKLIPDAKDIIYAGYPSHYKYLDIEGDAFTPRFVEGGDIKTPPLSVPVPTPFLTGDVSQDRIDEACVAAAANLGADKRWAGGEPKLLLDLSSSGGGKQYMCDVTLAEVYRLLPLTFDPATGMLPNDQCRKLAESKGLTSGGFSVPRDPAKNTWWCIAVG
jgi:hypothetical protein